MGCISYHNISASIGLVIIVFQCPLNIINLHWKDGVVCKLYIISKVGGILSSLIITFCKVKKVYCIREMRLKHFGGFLHQCFSGGE